LGTRGWANIRLSNGQSAWAGFKPLDVIPGFSGFLQFLLPNGKVGLIRVWALPRLVYPTGKVAEVELKACKVAEVELKTWDVCFSLLIPWFSGEDKKDR